MDIDHALVICCCDDDEAIALVSSPICELERRDPRSDIDHCLVGRVCGRLS